MATELGKAYVQIIPSAQGIGGSISEALNGEASSAGKSAGLGIAGAIKGAVVAAGIGTVVKESLDAGGALQQSFGGLDTLYESAASSMKDYAYQAQSAGISANTYAEQAVSFGASLKQAFGGDVTKAAESANTAILDMADNSAKMGTDISSIQYAYQGFAKQNYTMLDNLKLGYGGTKAEMERLLEDATKLSGVEYNMDNLGDVYEAIHVIQEDLNLTGVAAAEAEGTFTGSFGSMKAAAENLLANLSLGQDIGPQMEALGGSIAAFVGNNLLPMLGNIITAIPDLVVGMGQAFITNLPAMMESLLSFGGQIVEMIKQGFEQGPGLLTMALDFLTTLGQGITENLPTLLAKGVEIITSLVNGILENLPQLITVAGQIIINFASFLQQNLPTILAAGVQILINVVNGIIQNLPQILAAAAKVILTFVTTIVANYPQILQKGIELLGKLIIGIIQTIPKLIAAIPKIINAIKDTLMEFDWVGLGCDILEGIKNGIVNTVSAVVSAARAAGQAIWDSIASFFRIGSPSKLMAYAGEMLDQGLAGGIAGNTDLVDKAVSGLNSGVIDNLSMKANYDTTSSGSTNNVYDLLAQYLPQLAAGDITIPVYLGNDVLDTTIIDANQRINLRSGGRA